MVINKKTFSVEEIKNKINNLWYKKIGWDIKTQVRAEYGLKDGRIIVRKNLVAREIKLIIY